MTGLCSYFYILYNCLIQYQDKVTLLVEIILR